MSYLSFLSLCFNLSSLSAIVLPFLSLIRPFVSFHSALPSFLLLSCAARPFSTLGPILPVLLYTCRAPSCSPVLSFVVISIQPLFCPSCPPPAPLMLPFSFPPPLLSCPVLFSCWGAFLVGRSVRCLAVGGVLCLWQRSAGNEISGPRPYKANGIRP